MSYLFQGGAFANAKQTISEPFDISTSGTLTLDLANGPYQRIKPTASTTVVTVADAITNLDDGTTLRLEVVQPSTGSCTVTWGSGIVWPRATAPTLATTAGEVDVIDCVVVTMSSTQYLACKHVSAYAPPSAGGGVVDESDIKHWWKMNAGVSSGSVADDGSDGTKSLTLSGPSNVTNGNHSGTEDVIDFDGVTDHAKVSAATTLCNDEISYSFWFKLTSSPGPYEAVFSLTSIGAWNDGIGGYFAAGTKFRFFSGYYNVYAEVTGIATSTWYHCACVLDVSGGIQKCYLNGSAGSSPGTVYSPAISSITSYWFGVAGFAYGTGPTVGNYNAVQLSDFRVYAKALSAANVSDIYNSGSGDWP